ncbi:putative toxin-antitoxin system toxin component, PIN family [Allosalinactinospora lopnorensis]|uniref:putative toxin-antitoxin system toxin component, PIN family n=1 Tax=Allosalinactinospora lopnorensis TaxID=1352348 RepID=UPI000623E4D5|nr:putative toxin-antitoxin system toxin component, PIN family [Allosalinactinospora lopnorensis]
MDKPVTVVIDPNVWIAAVINPYGTPARVVEAVMSDRIAAVVTQQLLDELASVLTRPKFRRWLSLADAVAFVETLGGKADLHPDPGAPSRKVRDPDDNYLVALAETAGAVIVTGDADLLETDLSPPAVTPRDLLENLA